LITDDQLTAMDNLTSPDVRQTNIFFRVIFFIFTYHCVAAMVGLFAWITKINSRMAISATLIIAGVIFYFLAEHLITVFTDMALKKRWRYFPCFCFAQVYLSEQQIFFQ
jgi:ABC-type multidrug transport system fused ATPase/permease subunit